MESTEVIANNDEHSIWLVWVLHLREEVGCQAEGQGNLGGLVEVGLEDALVEDEEGLEDEEVVLVGNSTTELVEQLRV